MIGQGTLGAVMGDHGQLQNRAFQLENVVLMVGWVVLQIIQLNGECRLA